VFFYRKTPQIWSKKHGILWVRISVNKQDENCGVIAEGFDLATALTDTESSQVKN